MIQPADDQTLTTGDVGTLDAGIPQVEETPLQGVQRAQKQLDDTKTWALSKADAIEGKLAALGGEPSPALKEALATLRASAA